MSTTLLRLATAAMPPHKPLLREALAAWRPGAAYYSETLDALVDITGNGHHMRFGSSVGADTNDPIMIDWHGQDSLWLPGITGQRAATPQVPLSGDFEFRFKASLDWATCPLMAPAGQRSSGSGTTDPGSGSFNVYVQAGVTHINFVNASDLTVRNFTSFALDGLNDGDVAWVRYRVMMNNGNNESQAEVSFSLDDGVTWQESSTGPQTRTLADGVNYGAASFAVGDRSALSSGTTALLGHMMRAVLYDGWEDADAPIVVNFDARDIQDPNSGWVDPVTGASFNITRPLTGYKLAVVRQPTVLFDGVDDMLQGPTGTEFGIQAGEPLTVVAVYRQYETRAVFDKVSKRGGTGAGSAGWRTITHTNGQPRAQVGDGSSTYTTTAPGGPTPAGTMEVGGWVFDLPGDIAMFLNGVETDREATTVVPGGTSGVPLRIGAFGIGGSIASPSPMEFYGAAIVRRVLSGSEQMQLAAELGAL